MKLYDILWNCVILYCLFLLVYYFFKVNMLFKYEGYLISNVLL